MTTLPRMRFVSMSLTIKQCCQVRPGIKGVLEWMRSVVKNILFRSSVRLLCKGIIYVVLKSPNQNLGAVLHFRLEASRDALWQNTIQANMMNTKRNDKHNNQIRKKTTEFRCKCLFTLIRGTAPLTEKITEQNVTSMDKSLFDSKRNSMENALWSEH